MADTAETKDWSLKHGKAPVCKGCKSREVWRIQVMEEMTNSRTGDKYMRPVIITTPAGTRMRKTELCEDCTRAHHERGTNPVISSDGKKCDEQN